MPLGTRDWRNLINWVALAIVAAVGAGAVWQSGPLLLQRVAQLWIVSDPPNSADAIVVLGGGLAVRPAAAAELYRQGLAPRIAVGFSELDRGKEEALNRTMLLRQGVPSTAITNFSFQPHSTYGEARGVLEWAKINGVKSVIIPIDIFPSRRVRWIFNRELAPAGIHVSVRTVATPWYGVEDWWRHQSARKQFRNELIKFVYYRLKY